MFWLTGYSRAAAVTNLLAGKMTTDLSIAGIDYSNEDLYAYCLAPPMGTLANEREAKTDLIPISITSLTPMISCQMLPIGMGFYSIWRPTDHSTTNLYIRNEIEHFPCGSFH